MGVALKILIADDSAVYRAKIRAALGQQSDFEIVAAVNNGQMALDRLAAEPVDLLILDMEMPVLDGISTLREIRKRQYRLRVIVFSSTTISGSEATLDALSAGADDFVTKPNKQAEENVTPEERIRQELVPKIRQFFPEKQNVLVSDESISTKNLSEPKAARVHRAPAFKANLEFFRPAAVVIASSTGGPAAHDVLFSGLSGQLRCPIFIAQHMPPIFTDTFAKRLASCSGLNVHEAKDGEAALNQVYVAPGDFHMTLKGVFGQVQVSLDQGPAQNFVRPAADPLFESAARIYGQRLLAVVLTGMGEDGLRGCQEVKQKNGNVLIQSEASCVVFGMPGAVYRAELFDAQGDLNEIRTLLKRMVLA